MTRTGEPASTNEDPPGGLTAIGDLECKLGYVFKQRELLTRALTHRSAGADNLERLEFLGDAALGFVVARELFASARDAQEERLTLMRASLVKGETLAEVARVIGLGGHLNLGEGERKTGGADRASILADALEAVFGAIACDGGIESVAEVARRLLGSRLANIGDGELRDSKTRLQEHLQANGLGLPEYVVVATAGEDHAPVYTVECTAQGVCGRGEGRSRREAEKHAASSVLAVLGPATGDV